MSPVGKPRDDSLGELPLHVRRQLRLPVAYKLSPSAWTVCRNLTATFRSVCVTYFRPLSLTH